LSWIDGCVFKPMYRVFHKKCGTLLLSISLPIISQFSEFFHWRTPRTVCNNVIIIYGIPPHRKCVSTLPCEISMKYAYLTIKTNKHFGKIEKKHFKPTLQCLYDTKLFGSNTVQCRTNHSSQCCSEVFFNLPNFLFLSLVFAYIYISQGSVEMHLLCGAIYNNLIIENCLQSLPLKEF